MKFDDYSDEEIVEGILSRNRAITEYFFFKKCQRIFSYVAYSVFGGRVNLNEVVNDFFIYLAQDDWHKLRQFDYRSKLTTWTTVVATRYFRNCKDRLIEKDSTDTPIEKPETGGIDQPAIDDLTMDVRDAVSRIRNDRYRMVIEKLYFADMAPEDLAEEMNITVDNLYNIRRRAIVQLSAIIDKKENYV